MQMFIAWVFELMVKMSIRYLRDPIKTAFEARPIEIIIWKAQGVPQQTDISKMTGVVVFLIILGNQ